MLVGGCIGVQLDGCCGRHSIVNVQNKSLSYCHNPLHLLQYPPRSAQPSLASKPQQLPTGTVSCRGHGWTGRGQLRAEPFSRVGPELLLIPPANRVGGGCCSEETGRSTSRSAFAQVVGLLNTYLPLTVIVFRD